MQESFVLATANIRRDSRGARGEPPGKERRGVGGVMGRQHRVYLCKRNCIGLRPATTLILDII